MRLQTRQSTIALSVTMVLYESLVVSSLQDLPLTFIAVDEM
jgi:hypothetical protein